MGTKLVLCCIAPAHPDIHDHVGGREIAVYATRTWRLEVDREQGLKRAEVRARWQEGNSDWVIIDEHLEIKHG